MSHLYRLGLGLVLILANLGSPISALHESDVGIVDWYQSHAGVPLTSSLSTAPTFHTKQGQPPTEALLLTATSSNVLAALHASNGSLAWRFIHEPVDNIIHYQKHGDVVVSLSGSGGSTLRTFDYSTGQLILEKRLHSPYSDHLLHRDDVDIGTAFAFLEESQDIFTLTSAHIVQRVSEMGRVHWVWESPDKTGTPSVVYVVGLAKSFTSFTVHITSLSTSTGELITSVNVSSSLEGPFGILTLSSDTTTLNPRVVWLESGTVRSVALVPNLTEKPTSLKDSTYSRIIDIGLQNKGHFVALKTDHTGHVFKLNADTAELKVIWEFADSARSDRYASSFYIGGLDRDGLPYIGRVFWSFILGKAAAHVYAPHLADGQGLVSGFTFNFDTETHGIISHVALHTAYVKELDLLPYIALTTSTGSVQLWQGDIIQWTREEGLSRLQVAEMVEFPERKSIAAYVIDEQETFAERARRQLTNAKGLPQYLFHFIRRFTTGSYASTHQRAAPASLTASTHDPLARDAFGFRQVIVTANDLGKIYGLDSSSGTVLWSRVLGLGWAAQIGGQIIPSKLFVVRTVTDGGLPEAVLVAQRRANNGLVDTVIFHVNALTGEDALGKSPADKVLQGLDLISGPLLGAYQLPGSSKAVVLLDEFRQAYVYPETPTNEKTFSRVVGKLNIALRTGVPGQPQLTGHQFSTAEGGRATAFATWTSSFPAGEEILSVIPRPSGPVATFGKVLGNRTTLYKYLNPHLFAITTASSNTCGVYVTDATTGSIVYHASIAASKGKGKCDLHATFVENWLVYVYWDEEYQWVGQTKGQRLVSVELYEGSKPDDKTRSSELSSYSNKTLAVKTIEQSYVFPHAITSLATTSTKYGVSTKDIIVANANGQIQSFPRLLLNPRRSKDKPTAEEQEEWLVQYDPVLPDDAHRVLSHNYHVANVRHILTAPALLESTSLIFAYGLDLFCTRVAPSGTFDVLSESFNKAQLVFTILGLAAAIMATRPMVQSKRLREKWYQ
ncbi:hypothetical protein B0F90DRAFT_1770565 [Multifurca ochricompacta]|uniref:ER membrane protein complex subunit 1 n=1 Tax=Multifurca ochricompacta TaxID=376703 RepID=A0AAD4QFR2_9AGAM|nr:hypothetical protein B0F90DRAFT_1770565 [Multifurca ochricompacta]